MQIKMTENLVEIKKILKILDIYLFWFIGGYISDCRQFTTTKTGFNTQWIFV